jgi:hypothetical protein
LDTLSSIPTLEEKSESTKIPYWLDLPGDLAANIFNRLDILTILTDVYALYSNVNREDMEKICCNAVKLSCGHLEEIIIDGYGTDDLLKCIADK